MIRKLAIAAILAAFSSVVTGAGVLAAPAAPAAGEAYQATVTKTVKLVEWQRFRTTRWQKAAVENMLLVGDTLRTGVEAKAELLYGDGSVTRVGSLTSLTLTGDNKRELRLDSGRVWLHIQKGGAGMKVITPGAVAAVTGTELMVEFDEKKKVTEVTVFEGSVNVSSDVGNLVRVIGGTTTMVPFNAPAAAPVPLDTRKLQERENIFRPLSVKDNSAQPKTDTKTDGKTETKTESTSETKTDGDKTKTEQGTSTTPDTQVNTTAKPENTTSTTTTATPPDTASTVKPGTTATDAGKNATSPDLKGQNQTLGDPRFINGSPTTGTIHVIIK